MENKRTEEEQRILEKRAINYILLGYTIYLVEQGYIQNLYERKKLSTELVIEYVDKENNRIDRFLRLMNM